VTNADRERVGIAVLVAVVLHAGIAVAIGVFGFELAPYPETEPVFVTLPDYVEPEPEEVQPEPEEPEPVVATQPEPAVPEQQTGVQQRTNTAQPEPVAPAPAAPQPAPAPSAAPPRTTAQAPPEPEVDPEAAARARGDMRSGFDLMAGIDDQEVNDSASDLPGWVVAGEVSVRPEESLSAAEQQLLGQKRVTVPGFENRLAELVDALQNPAGPMSAPTPAESGTPEVTHQGLPGDGIIEWFGDGERELTSFTLPRLSASDFGGQVPAVVNYIIVFEVNSAGSVIPGSLILRQSSGYTLADQKVRQTVGTWLFEPADGSGIVTAIATLQIARDEIQ
jgi:outer membrane biosynthesis protein TonB